MDGGWMDGRTAMLQYGGVRIHVVGVLRKPCPAKKNQNEGLLDGQSWGKTLCFLSAKKTHTERKSTSWEKLFSLYHQSRIPSDFDSYAQCHKRKRKVRN